jgi:aerobic carbon-monoxide dehydrogenase medium subunit
MLLRSVEYERPSSVAEALEALASGPGARVLAGGQSLVNVLKHRVASCDLLVDVSRLDELRSIDAGADGALRIGAAVTYDELDRSAEVRRTHPKLAEVAARTVDQQVRCRGTLGGNCCYNDPSSNFPPLLVALGATMHVASRGGMREVPADEFFFGPFSTAARQDELLHSVELAPVPDSDGVGYSSIQLAPDDWALARACAVVSANGSIERVRVVLGCVAPAPVRATELEERLAGTPATPESVADAAPAASAGLAPVSDVHASGEYRREMAAVVARRALLEAIAKAG